LREMPAGGEHKFLGTAPLAESLPLPILPHVPPLRTPPSPISSRGSPMGNRVLHIRENSRTRRTTLWTCCFVYLCQIRRLVCHDIHSACFGGHAHGRHFISKCGDQWKAVGQYRRILFGSLFRSKVRN